MSTLIIRPARRQDSMTIAALFRLSSDGYADYIWSQHNCPGMSLLAIGAQRYRRENTAFSYQNCLLAERDGRTLGMLHSFAIPHDSRPTPVSDPVLRAVSELEVPGSLYISSLAVFADYRHQGIGSRLLAFGHAKARAEEHDWTSLICFEENQDALRLYEAFGYEIVDRRPLTPHPMIHVTGDALLMRRSVALDSPQTVTPDCEDPIAA